eukprot:CAMPEP_0168339288 /NCGR_PEP_ID=MMETSP0213-20121227/13368_1 /TAXON_ID=151035 /ORGANISM="Euplotes harpa, Strain FSP1.4" /LENGTH=99 /DNA_ID=CAMNT_0008345283 /DNA_START=177 /DNA_END=476 /DNA_ORIENTATION=-
MKSLREVQVHYNDSDALDTEYTTDYYSDDDNITDETEYSASADQYEISPRVSLATLNVVSLLGKGAQASVYLCKHKLTHKSYALKVCDLYSKQNAAKRA